MALIEFSPARMLALGCAAMLPACASSHTPRPTQRTPYRVTWTATRTADHVPLISISTVAAIGRPATIRTDSIHPTEDKPAFPRFTVRLSATRNPDVLQLVSRVNLLETARNKKGKLKIAKRNIGALLPMRPGQTQLSSVPSDPVHLEVRLERD